MEIPLSTLETFGYYVSDFSDFYIIGESNEYTSKIAKDSVSLLEKRHNVRGKGIRDVIRSGGRCEGLFEGDLVYNVRISGECGSCARGALGDLCM